MLDKDRDADKREGSQKTSLTYCIQTQTNIQTHTLPYIYYIAIQSDYRASALGILPRASQSDSLPPTWKSLPSPSTSLPSPDTSRNY